MDDELMWAYVAGFTDGDGCVTRELAKGRYKFARIRWAQKESASEVLDHIAAFLEAQGLKVSGRGFSVATRGHKYPQRELAITNAADSRTALHRMLPYLVVKRERALEVLADMDAAHEAKQRLGNKYNVRTEQNCLFPDCGRPYYSKAMCKHHYDGVRRGRPWAKLPTMG